MRKKGFATEAKCHCESLTEHESGAHSYYVKNQQDRGMHSQEQNMQEP